MIIYPPTPVCSEKNDHYYVSIRNHINFIHFQCPWFFVIKVLGLQVESHCVSRSYPLLGHHTLTLQQSGYLLTQQSSSNPSLLTTSSSHCRSDVSFWRSTSKKCNIAIISIVEAWPAGQSKKMSLCVLRPR